MFNVACELGVNYKNVEKGFPALVVFKPVVEYWYETRLKTKS